VVLTDLLMPEQDGIGAILQMRRERPAARIVAMSGGGRIDKADYLTAAVKLGADAAVEKRDTDRLLKTVLGLLKSP
jgi:DNA-binding NarL/FixJ family response regulator